jgi:hypothetical protein
LRSLKETDYSKDLGVDERIILNVSYVEKVGGCGLDSAGSR